MGDLGDEIQLKCAFCGKSNAFQKDEVYISGQGGEILREKYCLYCGEPLIIECHNCASKFVLRERIVDQLYVRLSDGFWEPKISEIDGILGDLEISIQSYLNIAQQLKEQDFLLRQQEFLQTLPALQEKLADLSAVVEKALAHPSAAPLLKPGDKIAREVQKIASEIDEIQASIDPETKAVGDKKAKQLKKHVLFLDIAPQLSEFKDALHDIRKNEIYQEKEALKPGHDKLKESLVFDPAFWRIQCPICSQFGYYIAHSLYKVDPNLNQLAFIKSIATEQTSSPSKAKTTTTVSLMITMHIASNQEVDLHGQIKFPLGEGEVYTVGRTQIREADYQEANSEKFLYDAKDPLARVSSKQCTLSRRGDAIVLSGMEFDPRRVPTFYNDKDTDIRVKFPDGVEIQSGDQIIIPLTNEPTNPNIIEIKVIFA